MNNKQNSNVKQAPVQGPENRNVKVRYEKTAALYANNFVFSSSRDEVILNFSSGIIQDPETKELYLPVHSRIAMTVDGAKRLVSMLSQVIHQAAKSQALPKDETRAQLPPIKE